MADPLSEAPFDPRARDPDDERDTYELANLYPRETGLPVTVWASPRGAARHDARIKVSAVPGDRMVFDDAAVVAIRPEPRLLHGDLAPAVMARVAG